MMEYEGFGQVLAMSSAEFREGLAALTEQRAPDFIGAAATFTSDGLQNRSPSHPKHDIQATQSRS